MINNNIYIKNKDQYIKVKFDDIIWIQSEGDYCKIHTKKKKFLVRFSHTKLVEKLPATEFIRIHPKYSINSHYIVSIDTLNNKVLLENKDLPLSPTYKNRLIERLNCV